MIKKRTVAGGILAVGVAFGAMMMSLFPGLGIGVGGSSGTGDQQSSQPASLDPATEIVPAETESPVTPEISHEPPTVLEVLIDSRLFLIRAGKHRDGEYVPVELAQLVTLAKSATGNDDGFRVRVARRETARPSAEKALNEQLSAAGIAESEVLWLPDFVK